MRTPPPPTILTIEDPIELLLACHDKVRRFTRLTVSLRDHLARTGTGDAVDAQAREAAQAIMRYFNLAAPLHHDDEELDLFPALQAIGPASLSADMAQLAAEHAELSALWQSLLPWLEATAVGHHHVPPDTLETFVTSYGLHAQREEDLIYPSAIHLTTVQRKQISAAMVARRTLPSAANP